MPLKPLHIVDDFHVVFSSLKSTFPASLYHLKLSLKTVLKHILILNRKDDIQCTKIRVILKEYLFSHCSEFIVLDY